MELDFARKMFYPIKRLVEWDTFEVSAGDDACRVLSNLIRDWTQYGVPNDLSCCGACSIGAGDTTAAFVRLLGLADGIKLALFCDRDHLDALKKAGCTVFDESFSPLMDCIDQYPKLDFGNVALLDDKLKEKLAANFGFMELLGTAEHFSGLRSDDMDKAAALVEKQTLQHANIPNTAPDKGWMRAYWQHRNRIDPKVFSDVEEYSSCQVERDLVIGCQRIWDIELKRRHFPYGIKAIDFDAASMEEIEELASMFGIDSMIEAIYSGVPLNDVIA